VTISLARNPSDGAFISLTNPWSRHISEYNYKWNAFLGSFRALIEERARENREMTEVLSYVKQQAVNTFMRIKRITKENGSI